MTTNGVIGPGADQVYEIWNLTIFDTWIIRGKSKLCIYTKHWLLTINLLEQFASPSLNFETLNRSCYGFLKMEAYELFEIPLHTKTHHRYKKYLNRRSRFIVSGWLKSWYFYMENFPFPTFILTCTTVKSQSFLMQ